MSLAPDHAVLYHGGALADGHSPELTKGVSILVSEEQIAWIAPAGDEPDPGEVHTVDCAGATFVPGWSTATAT